jgi:RNA polymerase subunit RPABC4/transcription elongation factor Spt4
MKTVTRKRRVVCEECDDFEISKVYRGASATDGEREYAGIDLPEMCPVCGAATTVKRGDSA